MIIIRSGDTCTRLDLQNRCLSTTFCIVSLRDDLEKVTSNVWCLITAGCGIGFGARSLRLEDDLWNTPVSSVLCAAALNLVGCVGFGFWPSVWRNKGGWVLGRRIMCTLYCVGGIGRPFCRYTLVALVVILFVRMTIRYANCSSHVGQAASSSNNNFQQC